MASSTPSSGGVPDKRRPSEESTYQASTASGIRRYDARAPMSGQRARLSSRWAPCARALARMWEPHNSRKALNRERNRHATAVRVTPAARDGFSRKTRGSPNYADSAARWSTPDLAVEGAELPARVTAAGSRNGCAAPNAAGIECCGIGTKKRSFGRDFSAKRSGVRLRARPRA